MTKIEEQIVDIFKKLSEYLSKTEASKDDKYFCDDENAYILPSMTTNSTEGPKGEFKVIPLFSIRKKGDFYVDDYFSFGSKTISLAMKTSQKFNAFTVICMGHDYDGFNHKHSLPRDLLDYRKRAEVAKNTCIKKFLTDCNSFLSNEKVNGRSLKMKLANDNIEVIGEYNNIDHRWFGEFPYNRFFIPLALKVVYA